MLSICSSVTRPRRVGVTPLVLLVLLSVACTRSMPATDSVAVPPPSLDTSVAPVTPPPAVVDTTHAAAPPPVTRPSPSNAVPVDSTPSRPRPTPRPPHPVPLPMPGRGLAPLQADTGGDQASDQATDQAALDRLRREARALVHVDGCASAGQCAVQAIGARACGGPSEYLVYCPKSTDVAALQRKAAEIARADKAFNTKYNIASTCMYQMPPNAELVGGSCRAAAAGGGSPR